MNNKLKYFIKLLKEPLIYVPPGDYIEAEKVSPHYKKYKSVARKNTEHFFFKNKEKIKEELENFLGRKPSTSEISMLEYFVFRKFYRNKIHNLNRYIDEKEILKDRGIEKAYNSVISEIKELNKEELKKLIEISHNPEGFIAKKESYSTQKEIEKLKKEVKEIKAELKELEINSIGKIFQAIFSFIKRMDAKIELEKKLRKKRAELEEKEKKLEELKIKEAKANYLTYSI